MIFLIEIVSCALDNEQHVDERLETHVHAVYILHSKEHPSPFAKFPSSHCSKFLLRPSPQTVEQYVTPSVVFKYEGMT